MTPLIPKRRITNPSFIEGQVIVARFFLIDGMRQLLDEYFPPQFEAAS